MDGRANRQTERQADRTIYWVWLKKLSFNVSRAVTKQGFVIAYRQKEEFAKNHQQFVTRHMTSFSKHKLTKDEVQTSKAYHHKFLAGKQLSVFNCFPSKLYSFCNERKSMQILHNYEYKQHLIKWLQTPHSMNIALQYHAPPTNNST